MAQWDVFLSHSASSRTVKDTVKANCKTQAVITALAKFTEPDQWVFVAASEVHAGYYDRIEKATRQRDAEIDKRALTEDIERESFATYNGG